LRVSIWAIPQPLHSIPASKAKNNPQQTDKVFLYGTTVYTVDNNRGILKSWDTTKKAFNQPLFSKLPIGGKADDLTGNENGLYALDSKQSSVYVYNHSGTLLRTIDLSASPSVKFKKAIRILVNYQDYLYVLDAGRNELLAFTNEGMLMGKATISSPLSMCLGQDQNIRVLVNKGSQQEIMVFDARLNKLKEFKIQTPDAKKDPVIDIAINQYNELYVIYSLSTRIGKVDSVGKLLPKSTWGSKDKGASLTTFMAPTIIKTTIVNQDALIGIVDSFDKSLKLYQDNEFANTKPLEIPPLAMRPALEASTEPMLYDYVIEDNEIYYIYDTRLNQKPTKALVCKVEGKVIYTIHAISLAKQGMKGMNSFAVYKAKLYILDTIQSQVFVFDRINGAYLEKFSSKGSAAGRLNSPASIAVSPDGMIYIADGNNFRIAVFNENSMFMENIDLKKDKLKPNLLRVRGNYLYFLANNSEVHEVLLSNYKTKKLLTRAKKISSFDILYENRLGYIDAETQQLVVKNDGRTEATYFAQNSLAKFPGFGDINHIRYHASSRTLLISDRKSTNSRILRFYYSPKKPQTIKLSLTDELTAELMWEAPEGISKWLVTESNQDGKTSSHVTEPKYTISNPAKSICKYTISSISDDGKASAASQEIEDAYSHARYLRSVGDFANAVLAYRRAESTITDKRIVEEIVKTYAEESQHYIQTLEYEKALQSIDAALSLGEETEEYVLAKVDIFKLMKEYAQGITYLEKKKSKESKLINRQLISLYYLSKNYLKVKSLATDWIGKFGKDKDVNLYLAIANESLGDFSTAQTVMRDLVTIDDSFANNLMLSGLLIKTKNYDDAVSRLQRMLNRFSESPDSIHKLLGDAFYAQANFAYAADSYNNAIKINPDNAEYFYGAALAYQEMRQANEALINFAKAYRLNKTNVDYGFTYAKALEKASRYAEAMAILDDVYKYVSEDANSTEFHLFYFDLLTREHLYDDAYREIELAVKYAPDDITLREKLIEASDTREYYNRAKAPVDVKKYEFFKLYPSLQRYYDTNPIGTITLFNNKGISIQNVKVVVKVARITDKPFETTISSLLPNKEHQIDIIIPINQNVFNVCREGSASITTELFVEYTFDEQSRNYYDENKRIEALNISALNWKSRKQFASFVNPVDEHLRNFVSTEILSLFPHNPDLKLNKQIQRAMQIWSYYSVNGLGYVLDNTISNVADSDNDYVQYPFQTLDRRAGDCEDLLALLATSLSVIGVECGFIDLPGHVMLAFNTQMSLRDVLDSGIDSNHFIFRNDKYWIPIETTLLGKNSFSQSWLEALNKYQALISKETYPDLIEFADAHAQYPAPNWSMPIQSDKYGNSAAAQSSYNDELQNIMLLGQIAQEAEYLRTIKKYPSNLLVANEYALWCKDNNKLATAQSIWEQILVQDPRNLASLINLGNLMQETKQYENSRRYYLEALKQNQETEMLNLNLCILEYRSDNKSKAQEYFNKLTYKNALKKIDTLIYTELMKQGG
ncbi:MAG: tetratricopeptide repeat protein, partial [Candidatus Cloacimonetes bacterium]|nr:tetratricopeptide repeat protein [Candidatus Cloacimonadota bacterium]